MVDCHIPGIGGYLERLNCQCSRLMHKGLYRMRNCRTTMKWHNFILLTNYEFRRFINTAFSNTILSLTLSACSSAWLIIPNPFARWLILLLLKCSLLIHQALIKAFINHLTLFFKSNIFFSICLLFCMIWLYCLCWLSLTYRILYFILILLREIIEGDLSWIYDR